MNKAEILNRLKAGNENFVKSRLKGNHQDAVRREKVIKGQDPFAIILSCADSRVVPELIFDTGIGELFVVRVAGNVANTSTIASIEYAVAHLDAKVLMVLAHEDCGAVNAALVSGEKGKNLDHLLSHLQPAITASGLDAKADDIAKNNAILTAEELSSKSKIISSATESGKIYIIPAYYHLQSGQVYFL